MLGGRWAGAALGRVNPYVPVVVIAAGMIVFLVLSRPVGLGIGAGAVLAYLNGLFLSARVEVAADTGDMGRALMVMQIGMFSALAVIGVATVAMVHFSLGMAVAAAVGFLVTQLALLAVFFWTRGRNDVAAGRRAS